MLAVEAAVLTTVPAGLWAQLAFPSYTAVLAPDFGALENLDHTLGLPQLWKNNRRLWKGVPGYVSWLLPLWLWTCSLLLERASVAIILTCEEVWKRLCGEQWVDHCPWTVVATRKWPGLCNVVKTRAADGVVVCHQSGIGLLLHLLCRHHGHLSYRGSADQPPTFLIWNQAVSVEVLPLSEPQLYLSWFSQSKYIKGFYKVSI